MIEFHEQALDELRQSQAWYRGKSPDAAERLFRQTVRAVERLEVNPA